METFGDDESLTPTAPVASPPTAASSLKASDVDSVDGDNDELFMGPAEVSKKPKPATKASGLLPMLKNAKLNDVVVHAAESSTGQEDLKIACSVAGVELVKLSVAQFRMLCTQWGLKKFRKAKKQEILELIAQNKEWRVFYDNKGKEHKLSKEEVQGSKMRLLNVVFPDDFFESIINMNDRKLRPELDAGGAGSNKRRWAEVTESYNDTMNKDECGHYAFIEDDHIVEFVTTHDLCVFKKLDWQKAATWFKEITSDCTAIMLQCSKSGSHEPDFMCYVDGKPQTYCCRLHAMENPECHKAFNVLLDDTLFSESTDIKGSNKKIKLTKAPGSNDKKALILKDVAASMTEAFGEAQAKSAT
jgi:hypothetical protein